MGLLFNILGAPVSGPLHLTRWICGKIQEVAEREVGDQDKLKSDLIELQMRRELEEIAEADYVAEEERILSEINRVRKRSEKG